MARPPLPTPPPSSSRRKAGEQGIGPIESSPSSASPRKPGVASLQMVGDPRQDRVGKATDRKPFELGSAGAIRPVHRSTSPTNDCSLQRTQRCYTTGSGFGVAATSIIDYPVARVSQPALAPGLGAGHEQHRSLSSGRPGIAHLHRNLAELAGAHSGRGSGGMGSTRRPLRAPGVSMVPSLGPSGAGNRRRFPGRFPGGCDPYRRLPPRTSRRHVPGVAADHHPEQGARPLPQARARPREERARTEAQNPVRAASCHCRSPDEDESGATDGEGEPPALWASSSTRSAASSRSAPGRRSGEPPWMAGRPAPSRSSSE